MGDFHIPNDPHWQWAYNAILYTVGEEFPKGDPSELKALSHELEHFGQSLMSGVYSTANLGRSLGNSQDGPAADAFAQFHKTITKPVPQGMKKANVASQVANQANQQIDYGQIQADPLSSN